MVLVVDSKYGGSKAVNELQIECGRCHKVYTLNRPRYYKHFGDNCKFYVEHTHNDICVRQMTSSRLRPVPDQCSLLQMIRFAYNILFIRLWLKLQKTQLKLIIST